MMKTSEHRKPIPIGVKLHACLLLLGFSEEEISGGLIWDHTPPLGLRFVDPETGQMVPHPNDPRHIQPLRKADNALKTYGPKACAAGGDIHAIAKTKRLAKGQEEFRTRMTSPDKGKSERERATKPKRAWPKRRFANGSSQTKGKDR